MLSRCAISGMLWQWFSWNSRFIIISMCMFWWCLAVYKIYLKDRRNNLILKNKFKIYSITTLCILKGPSWSYGSWIYIVAARFIGGGKRSTRRQNNPPVASHWQTLSHDNVVSSTSCLSGIWTHNVSGNRHWLYSKVGINYPYW